MVGFYPASPKMKGAPLLMKKHKEEDVWIGNPKLRMAGIDHKWGVKAGEGMQGEVGQMVWLPDALLWFIGAHCCSEAAVRSVHREGALLLSGKQMKRFDCHLWSKGSLGESWRQRSRRSSPVAWISQKTSCTSETPRELITRLTVTTVFAKDPPR